MGEADEGKKKNKKKGRTKNNLSVFAVAAVVVAVRATSIATYCKISAGPFQASVVVGGKRGGEATYLVNFFICSLPFLGCFVR